MQSNQQIQIQELIDAGRLERVHFDPEDFPRQVAVCSKSRADAVAMLEIGLLHGAFTAAYTFMRKAATLLLSLQEVRPTARGGHRVIAEALKFEPQLSLRLCSDYDNLRVMRNEIEYSTSALQYADHRHVNLSIKIGDQLLAIAQSISS